MAVYANIIHEKGFWKKATLGIKLYGKDLGDTAKFYKERKNDRLLHYVENCDDLDMLDYLSKDLSIGTQQAKLLIDRMEQLEKYPDLKTNWSEGVRKNYIDKGVTSADVKAYEKWSETVLRPAINKRKKELRAKNK